MASTTFLWKAVIFISVINLCKSAHYRSIYACEGEELLVYCGDGYGIRILDANYGRYSSLRCNEAHKTDLSLNCFSYRSYRMMINRCDQQPNCTVEASNSVFGDPCPETTKYLYVHYTCFPIHVKSTAPAVSTDSSPSNIELVPDTTLDTVFAALNYPDPPEPSSLSPPSSSSISTTTTTKQYTQQNSSPFISSPRPTIATLSNGTMDIASANNSATCGESWVTFGQYCYLVASTRLNWEAASIRCEKLGGHLTSVLSKEENDFLRRLMSAIASSIWIGLHDFDKDGNFVWDDGAELNYTNWRRGMQFHTYGGGQCGVLRFSMFAAAEWMALPCQWSYPYICKKGLYAAENATAPMEDIDSPTTENTNTENDNVHVDLFPDGSVNTSSANSSYPCEEGWIQYGQNCYILERHQYQWITAQKQCLSVGGNLASIHSSKQNDFMTEMMSNKSVTSSWIGLHDRNWEGKYSWIDGSDVDFSDCRASEHYGQCPLSTICFELIYNPQRADFKRGWNDSHCWYFKPFICQKAIVTTENITELEEEEFDKPNPSETPASTNTSSLCEEGWLRYDQHCYTVKRNAMTWERSSAVCSSIGGHLASIHSYLQNDFLKNILVEKLVRRCWIGGFNYSRDNTNKFEWTDGSRVDYVNWSPGGTYFYNSKSHCTLLTFTYHEKGVWKIFPCDTSSPFICQKQILGTKNETNVNEDTTVAAIENASSRNEHRTVPSTEVTTKMKEVSSDLAIKKATNQKDDRTVPVNEATTTERNDVILVLDAENFTNRNGNNTDSTSVSTIIISVVLTIAFCAFLGGMIWYKRPWLVDKRAKLATVLYRSCASTTKQPSKWMTEILINDQDQEDGGNFNYKHLN